MAFDKQEWLNSATKPKTKGPDVASLNWMAQAEVSAENLTGMPEWTIYQQILQGATERTQEQVKQLELILRSPDLVDHDAMLKIKLSIALCDGRIDAWRTALMLPSDIKKSAQSAQEILDRMMKETDAPK